MFIFVSIYICSNVVYVYAYVYSHITSLNLTYYSSVVYCKKGLHEQLYVHVKATGSLLILHIRGALGIVLVIVHNRYGDTVWIWTWWPMSGICNFRWIMLFLLFLFLLLFMLFSFFAGASATICTHDQWLDWLIDDAKEFLECRK